MEILLLLSALIKLSIKKKVIILAILFIVALRLPFYLHSTGLITTSDNALEALQSLEMKESKIAPFYLLEATKHGTLKYLLVAFIWDLLGTNYLYLVLVQLMIFIALLYLVYEIFKPSIDPMTLFLFIFFTNFAFMEVMFNYSLSIRGGSYLEMLLLFCLGVYLFDFEFLHKTRILLAYYFIFFSIYLHPSALLLAFSFILCTIIYSLKSRQVIKNFALLLGGLMIGGSHLLYYLFLKTKPMYKGSWGRLEFISLSGITPKVIVHSVKNFKAIFWKIFNHETSYLISFFPEMKIKHVFSLLNETLIYVSLAIFIIGLILVFKKLIWILSKKHKLVLNDWPYIFFLVLFISISSELVLLNPDLFSEPRYHLDLVLLIIMSYLIVLSTLFRLRKTLSFRTAVIFSLFLLFTTPHYFCFLDMTHRKESSYQEILSVLVKNKVKYLTTDFIIAYPIYFLSHRRILVSDSLGPLTIARFYPRMRAKVDKMSRARKAFLFFSEDYPAEPWRKQFTKIIKMNLLIHLKKENTAYKTCKFEDFILIIPSRGKAGDKKISRPKDSRPSKLPQQARSN